MWRLRVKQLAQERNYTLARFHRESGLDLKTVQKLWHDQQYNTSLATLARVAKTLNVPINTLIEDGEDHG
jgi:transcriptional regulator with XRE-family HTH domain